MKVKMLKSQKGSENGVVVKDFMKDKMYTMTENLAEVFVREKWAVNMDTPENLEKERKNIIKKLGLELEAVVKNCFDPGLDSIQLIEQIETLKNHPVTEDIFQEKFKAALKIKTVGIKDAEKSLKDLNKANSKKGK